MHPTPLVVISGATGLIGSALVEDLLDHGYDVVRLVRSAKTPRNIRAIDSLWNPTTGSIDTSVIDGAYAVINLAGAGISDKRWDRISRKEIRTSRMDATRTLVRAINGVQNPPKAFLSGSATGIYGFPDRVVDETTPPGTTFLASVCVDWERAASHAMSVGTRVTNLRTGLVMTPQGGALKKILLPLKIGAGGPLGSGDQKWSWISLEDQVRAIRFLLTEDRAWGPVNLVSPDTKTNAELTDAIGKALGKPTRFRVPAKALRAALGQFADEITNGVEVRPTVLKSFGFTYMHENVTELAEWIRQQD